MGNLDCRLESTIEPGTAVRLPAHVGHGGAVKYTDVAFTAFTCIRTQPISAKQILETQ